MKALVYHGPGQKSWDSVPDPATPRNRPTRSSASTRRRSAAPTCTSSRATCPRRSRARCSAMRPSARSSRSALRSPRRSGRSRARLVHHVVRALPLLQGGQVRPLQGGGGWIFGYLIDGLQAEFVRVPFADTSLYKVPEGVKRRAGAVRRRHPAHGLRGRRAERARRAGRHGRDGGRGPIGLAAIMTAKLHTPGRIIAIDLADSRLQKAREFGAYINDQQRRRGRAREGHGPDRRPGRRRGDSNT